MSIEGVRRTPSSGQSHDRVRLLIVDDHADLAMAIHLGFADHPAIESIGWVDASELIVETVRGQAPDVVLLDLTMPGVDPLEALVELRALGVRAIVIAFSGYDDDATVERARVAGVDGFLTKQADFEAIATAILRLARSEPG